MLAFSVLAFALALLCSPVNAFAVGTNKRIFRRGDSARNPLRLHARDGIGASVGGFSTVAQIGTAEATVGGMYAGVTTVEAAVASASATATGLVTASEDKFGGIGIKLVSTTFVPAPTLSAAVAVVGSSTPSSGAELSSSSEKASSSVEKATPTKKAKAAGNTKTVFKTRTETVTVSA